MTLLLVLACETMEPSGGVFEPVREAPPAAASAPAPTPADTFPVEPPLTLSSEQMAAGTVSPAAAAGVDVEALPAPPAPLAAPEGLPSATRWPARLLSTLPGAQPPRAVLGLPGGEEVVVAPGSMLAEAGLVVMTIGEGRVELAEVEPAGDHAIIRSVVLTAQYP